MSKENTIKSTLPDVAKEPYSGPNAKLNWVGMSGIEIPVILNNKTSSESAASIQAYVDLADKNAKGIHMSRLYIAVDEMLSGQYLTPQLMRNVVESFLESHKKVSTQAYIECRSDFLERRDSLISDNSGWKGYKVRTIASHTNGEFKIELTIEVPYSSTCPCSASLARMLIKQGFEKKFSNKNQISVEEVSEWLSTKESISATPHSQRSIAQIKVVLDPTAEKFPVLDLINSIENALKTPVQAAVKREDEQEFARLNAANTMFCEDAARRLFSVLDNDSQFSDFWVRVDHLESLHAHDAVAVVVKGVKNGYSDDPREFPK